MIVNVGYIPYLNMVPFHFGFGPHPMAIGDHRIHFRSLSPSSLGTEAEKGGIDAGAMSLVDTFRLGAKFELLGNYGIGVKRAAQSVFLFSKVQMPKLHGICGVTDETATSFRLLQVLLEHRYSNQSVRFGRISSARLLDDSLESVLLIGDEALQAAKEGIPGLPIVTDLAEEWYQWQGTPFVFARWVVRKNLPADVKNTMIRHLETSLKRTETSMILRATEESKVHHFSPPEIQAYWEGFVYRLTTGHERSIKRFEELFAQCLTA